MIPKKEIQTVTKSYISAHCAEFTFSNKVEALNFAVENILNIDPSSPLPCKLSDYEVNTIISIICMGYAGVQELGYYGPSGNQLVTDDDRDLLTVFIYYCRY